MEDWDVDAAWALASGPARRLAAPMNKARYKDSLFFINPGLNNGNRLYFRWKKFCLFRNASDSLL
jgi:hypothetical protein